MQTRQDIFFMMFILILYVIYWVKKKPKSFIVKQVHLIPVLINRPYFDYNTNYIIQSLTLVSYSDKYKPYKYNTRKYSTISKVQEVAYQDTACKNLKQNTSSKIGDKKM